MSVEHLESELLSVPPPSGNGTATFSTSTARSTSEPHGGRYGLAMAAV